MAAFLRKHEGKTSAPMRIVVGFLFPWHGAQKLLGFLYIAAHGAGRWSVDGSRGNV